MKTCQRGCLNSFWYFKDSHNFLKGVFPNILIYWPLISAIDQNWTLNQSLGVEIFKLEEPLGKFWHQWNQQWKWQHLYIHLIIKHHQKKLFQTVKWSSLARGLWHVYYWIMFVYIQNKKYICSGPLGFKSQKGYHSNLKLLHQHSKRQLTS